jgi:hypothetical protein
VRAHQREKKADKTRCARYRALNQMRKLVHLARMKAQPSRPVTASQASIGLTRAAAFQHGKAE